MNRLPLFFLMALLLGAMACKKGSAPNGGGGDSTSTPAADARTGDLSGIRTLNLDQTFKLSMQNVEGQCQPINEAAQRLMGLPAIAPEAAEQVKYLALGQWQLPSQVPAVLFIKYTNAGAGYYELYVTSPKPNGQWAALRLGDISQETHSRHELEVYLTTQHLVSVSQRIFTAENPEGPFVEQEDQEASYGYENGAWILVAG